jgi:hypothetical protein
LFEVFSPSQEAIKRSRAINAMIIRPNMTRLKTPGSQGDKDPPITTDCMMLSAQTYPFDMILTSVEFKIEKSNFRL